MNNPDQPDDAVNVLRLSNLTNRDDVENLNELKARGWDLLNLPYVMNVVKGYDDEYIKVKLIENAIALSRSIDPDPDPEGNETWAVLMTDDYTPDMVEPVIRKLVQTLRFNVSPELETLMLNADKNMPEEMIRIKAAIWRMALAYFSDKYSEFVGELDAVFEDGAVEEELK